MQTYIELFSRELAATGISGKIRPYMLPDQHIGYCVNTGGGNNYINYLVEPGRVLNDLLSFSYVKNQLPSCTAIEYGQLNTHKDPHLGHLRNICIGKALTALSGSSLHSVTYLGDHGMHVAKCMLGLRANIQDIQQAYEYGNNQSNDLISCEMTQWDHSDPLYINSRNESLHKINDLFSFFDVGFEDVYYESDFIHKKMLLDVLSDIGYWGNGDYEGCFVVDLDELGLVVLIKSDGTLLYAAKDILLALQYSKKYDKILYVVGQEQTQYFEQLQAILTRIPSFNAQIEHVGYGLVTFQGSKMSSRNNAASATHMIDHLQDTISKLYSTDLETTKLIVSNIIYYEMLKSDYKIPLRFISDDQYLRNQGMSYIMYQYCRARAVYQDVTFSGTLTVSDEMIKLLRALCYGLDCIDSGSPQKIFSEWFVIARAFSNFYEKIHISGNPQAQTLSNAFINVNNIFASLLDMHLPDHM
jgi:arginyl-tRNA synthetase